MLPFIRMGITNFLIQEGSLIFCLGICDYEIYLKLVAGIARLEEIRDASGKLENVHIRVGLFLHFNHRFSTLTLLFLNLVMIM